MDLGDLSLSFKKMDSKHIEFIELLDIVKSSSKDDFLKNFEKLIEHTREHFEYEENLMREKNFYGFSEHKEEHTNLLNEMEYFYNKTKKGLIPFGKSYINDYAFDKFKRHVVNIDSQLANFLKNS